MLDYAALRAVAAVVRTGSFEKAARQLSITPSAVSQRVKQLEERLGTVLIVRANPCEATETGEWLCRHMDQVEMLEGRLKGQLPTLVAPRADGDRVTLHVATNADSLGTWFLSAVAGFTRQSEYLLDIAVDDQDHTADWLKKGRVLAAVTSLDKPVTGCRKIYLGKIRYHATASPDFMDRHFSGGVTVEALARAPALTFNRKDRLQSLWLERALGADISHATHWLPSTQAFVDAALAGMGWGMNPSLLVAEHLANGRLQELVPGATVETPLYWQVNRLVADELAGLTRAVVAQAERVLER